MARNVRMVVADPRRCLGCKSCEIQCALAHCQARTLEEALRLDSPPQARMHVEPAGRYGMPIQCQHCQDAPCVAVCPTGAMACGIEEGPPVLLDRQKCNGCRMCELVCPFGVVEISRDGKAMIKCDLCIQRTKAGEEPACVAACPTGALRFVDVDEDVRRRRREMATLAAADPQGRAEERPPRPRGAARGAGAWNAKLALAECRSCGRPSGPEKVLAFLHRKLPGKRPEMEVCPACRRARTAEQLARNSGLPLVEEAWVEVPPVGARGNNERSTCPEK